MNLCSQTKYASSRCASRRRVCGELAAPTDAIDVDAPGIGAQLFCDTRALLHDSQNGGPPLGATSGTIDVGFLIPLDLERMFAGANHADDIDHDRALTNVFQGFMFTRVTIGRANV